MTRSIDDPDVRQEDKTMIGLRRGTVKLYDHEKEWETEASNTISRLKQILGHVAKDIQHVGSTSIVGIKAKPIIDIALAVDDFKDILGFEKELRDAGFYYRPHAQPEIQNQLLFACGNFYEGTGDLQTHFIHVVLTNSMDWINYINFRDYLNSTPSAAREYENLKVSLALQAPADHGREIYLRGKRDFIVHTLRKALVHSYLGKMVNIRIDRLIESVHPQFPDRIYPGHVGHIPHVANDDGEALGVYWLGAEIPAGEDTARIIGIVHRHNDGKDMLIAVPDEFHFNRHEISEALHFQEPYFEIELISESEMR